MSRSKRTFLSSFLILIFMTVGVSTPDAAPVIDAAWLKSHLKPSNPRISWRESDEDFIRARIASDEAARVYYDFIVGQADGIIDLPVLERIQEGRRILQVSRNALKRVTHLAFAWRMTGEQRYLERLELLLESVSGFTDWNPSHFLDTAEMSLAVAIGLDWTGEALAAETRERARSALLNLGLRAGEDPRYQGVFSSRNNWNQVCNAGMVAAAVVLGDEEPELAARVINRMVETLPTVLETYAPDGVYVEGPMYWSYGTEFNVVLYDLLESALGTSFGFGREPGFMESVDFVQLMRAPSGFSYNFYDSNTREGLMAAKLWFALKSGNARYIEREKILEMASWNLDPSSHSGRLLPVEFLWFARFEEKTSEDLPLNWVGHGQNPVGVFRSAFDDPNALYVGFKGGKGTNGHGNLDAGSFIFELNGVRWAIDPGNQGYHELEVYYGKVGGGLWSSAQDSVRWDLLTKNNFGHSTLTIDGELHRVGGLGEIVAFDEVKRTATLDLSAPLGEQVLRAERSFTLIDDSTVVIQDRLELAEGAKGVRWQMVTQAEVDLVAGGAVLSQDGESLRLEVVTPEGIQVSVTRLDPPPHPMDKQMPNLKRIDVLVPAYLSGKDGLGIEVRLSAVK